MREHFIRLTFSALAASVTLAMAQEWAAWALERKKMWDLVPALVLVLFSLFEANKVWRRGEALLRISHAPQ